VFHPWPRTIDLVAAAPLWEICGESDSLRGFAAPGFLLDAAPARATLRTI